MVKYKPYFLKIKSNFKYFVFIATSLEKAMEVKVDN